MNDYHTLKNPGGYNKPHREKKEAGWEFAQHSGGNTIGKKQKYNNNVESHCLHCGSEDHWDFFP